MTHYSLFFVSQQAYFLPFLPFPSTPFPSISKLLAIYWRISGRGGKSINIFTLANKYFLNFPIDNNKLASFIIQQPAKGATGKGARKTTKQQMCGGCDANPHFWLSQDHQSPPHKCAQMKFSRH